MAKPRLSNVRDRVREVRRVSVSDLRRNPKNWRTHPGAQKGALAGLLAEVGFAVPVIAWERPDGSLELLDGHLRLDTMPQDAQVPVVVLDVNEREADKLLATIDPLSALAGQDDSQLVALLAGVSSDSADVQKMLSDLLPTDALEDVLQDEVEMPEAKFEVLVACRSEQEQAELLQRLTEEGFTCRARRSVPRNVGLVVSGMCV